MKKIFALILAIVMIASMSVVVFAEDPTDKAAGPVGGSTTLTYGVCQAYEVVIPGDQVFAGDDENGYTATGTVEASGVKIAKGEKFTITVTSANSWKLVDTEGAGETAISDPVDYEAKVDGASIKTTGKVLELESTTEPAGNSGAKTITFTTAGTGQEGTYKDQLTFAVAIA